MAKIKIQRDKNNLSRLLKQSRSLLYNDEEDKCVTIQEGSGHVSENNSIFQSTQMRWTMKTKVSDRYKPKKTTFVQTRSMNQQTDEVSPNPYQSKTNTLVMTADKSERPRF